MNTEFIQLKEVTKRFGKNVVLENASVSIPEGQIIGIVGASGEGKTTILKMIIGFYKPTKGDVLFLKRKVLIDLKNMRQLFGFSTEDGSFYDYLTVRENLFHFGYLYKMNRREIKERAKKILKLVGLEHAERTQARYLSVGMKKRLDIACSIIHDPEVLILDEPTADLDPLLRSQILYLIKKINQEGTTIILTTQLLEEMDKVCDSIAILHNKKIIEEGHPGSIRRKYKTSDLNGVFDRIFGKRGKKEIGKESFRHIKPAQASTIAKEKDRQSSVKKEEVKDEESN